MSSVGIELASIDDLVTVAGEHEQFWGERELSHLHHPMLIHQFGRTALVVRGEDGHVLAYLFGLVTAEGVGYVHLVSVREGHRRRGLARALYGEFEERAAELGARVLKSFTQPVNERSIAFHLAMGFTAWRTQGYVGEGQTRVVFTKPVGQRVKRVEDQFVELGGGASMRPVAMRDVEPLHALVKADREHLRPWLPFADQPYDSTAAFVERAVRDAAAGQGLGMAIFKDAAMAGMVGFVNLSREHRATSIGYWLAESAQGQGIMTRAVRAMLAEAFATWGMERVEIRVAADNARSRAVPERLGFRLEGELRRAQRIDGSSHDEVVYGMVASDWAGQARPRAAPRAG